MKNIFFFALVLLFGNQGFAQDTLQMLNGKTKLIEVVKEEYNHVYYRKYKSDSTLGRKRKKDLENVFAIAYQDSAVSQIYREDSLIGNYWTISEMKYYLEGRRQARKHFRPYKTFLIGLGVGTGVSLYSIFPPVYNHKDVYTQVYDTITNTWTSIHYKRPEALAIPMPYWEVVPLSAYVYFAGRITDDKKFKADEMDLFKNKMFVMGYKETVINRQVYAAAGSSFGSYLVTTLGYVIFDPVEN